MLRSTTIVDLAPDMAQPVLLKAMPRREFSITQSATVSESPLLLGAGAEAFLIPMPEADLNVRELIRFSSPASSITPRGAPKVPAGDSQSEITVAGLAATFEPSRMVAVSGISSRSPLAS